MSVGQADFAEEYRAWLISCWQLALVQLLAEAVAEEEYEWAGEIQLALDEVQLAEDEVY
jgi:hypothetical protein